MGVRAAAPNFVAQSETQIVRTDLTSQDSSAHLKSDRAVVTARRLRKSMTPSEQRLWYELRRLPLERTHFRRQSPFGPFIVDFICHGARLVVEVDGGAHKAPDVALRDAERQQWLEVRGYRVMRFTSARVIANASAVAQEVFTEAAARVRIRSWL